MSKPHPAARFSSRTAARDSLSERLLELVGHIPSPRTNASKDPATRAKSLARSTAIKTAATAGTLALPPGPLGWLTIAPELLAVWKMQRQMVSDIAGLYGREDLLSREQMLYCLFGHNAAGAFRDVVIRAGERYLIRKAPLSALYAIANKIIVRIAQRSASRLVTRWIPVAGALGVAGYVYVDTGKVADTAIALFASDVSIEDEATAVEPAAVKPKRARRKPAATD